MTGLANKAVADKTGKAVLLATTLWCGIAAANDTPAPTASVAIAGAEMGACNTATVKALGFITVGKATLYRTDCASATPLAPPMALEFGYKREIPGNAMGKAATVMLERNVEEGVFARFEERIDRFNASYRDIKPGDRYQLLYSESGAMELRYNGDVIARESGHDFALTYLQIWFGPRPYSDAMKQALLDGLGEPASP